MSGGNVSTARERRNSRLYLTLWGEGFLSPDEGFREWRANTDIGFRLTPGLELGATAGWNYQTRDVGVYLSGSFSPARDFEVVLRGHGGVSWGDVSSAEVRSNPLFLQWQSRDAAHRSCEVDRERAIALNERRSGLGLPPTIVPNCTSGPGVAPAPTLTEERTTTHLGYHVFAGLHAGYLFSEHVAAVAHIDLHYNSLVPPRADVHASLGFEFNLSPAVLEIGCGLDGDGGFQCMAGATLAFNLFPATHHNHGHDNHEDEHEDDDARGHQDHHASHRKNNHPENRRRVQ